MIFRRPERKQPAHPVVPFAPPQPDVGPPPDRRQLVDEPPTDTVLDVLSGRLDWTELEALRGKAS